jgi:glutathione S-transferase
MIKLYDHPLSGNCYKVRLALNQLGAPYERVFVDIFKGAHQSLEHQDMNPNMKIPVLQVGDFTMWESNAILLYLGRKFAPNDLFPEDPEAFGRVVQWLLFGKTTIDPNLALARYYMRFLTPEERDENEILKLHEQGYKALTVLDDHLSQNEFLRGAYSIADIGCYPYVALSPEGGFDLTPYSSVLSWCERIKSTPGYIGMED